jgi:predicted ArsR family transcriptional regulator
MENQTRQLLEVLADDLTDELLDCLARGESLETELQQCMPCSRQTTARRLEKLELYGLVVARHRRSGGRGRPTRAWTLADSEVLRFLREADELTLRLLEGNARRHREAVRPVATPANVRPLRQ